MMSEIYPIAWKTILSYSVLHPHMTLFVSSLTLKSANHDKSRLLFSSVEIFKQYLEQTVWTQIRLLLYVSSLIWVHAVCLYT